MSRVATSAQARRVLDKNLRSFSTEVSVPQAGWIRSIREALGMTRAQLGARMFSSRKAAQGISASTVQDLERQEKAGTITLDSLQRAAQAMHCELVYALVPHESLEKVVEKQAQNLSQVIGERTKQTMHLESQDYEDAAQTLTPDDLISSYSLWR